MRRHGGHKTAEVRDARRTDEGRGLRGGGGAGKSVGGIYRGRPHSIRYQRPLVVYNNCSPGGGGITQDGATRGETFHGETDR